MTEIRTYSEFWQNVRSILSLRPEVGGDLLSVFWVISRKKNCCVWNQLWTTSGPQLICGCRGRSRPPREGATPSSPASNLRTTYLTTFYYINESNSLNSVFLSWRRPWHLPWCFWPYFVLYHGRLRWPIGTPNNLRHRVRHPFFHIS